MLPAIFINKSKSSRADLGRKSSIAEKTNEGNLEAGRSATRQQQIIKGGQQDDPGGKNAANKGKRNKDRDGGRSRAAHQPGGEGTGETDFGVRAAIVMQPFMKRRIGGDGDSHQKKQRQQTGQHRFGQTVTLNQAVLSMQAALSYTNNRPWRKRKIFIRKPAVLESMGCKIIVPLPVEPAKFSHASLLV
jgi:hypothetical protein